MKLVSIRSDLLTLYEQDEQVLKKSGRPYVAVMSLRFRDRMYHFAVPIRSNIPAAAPKEQYFALPPRPSTRPGNRHGLHYIKMFPVDRKHYMRYRTEGNDFAQMIEKIINKNTHRIVKECQSYLDRYAAGQRPRFSTDLDYLLSLLYPQNAETCTAIKEVDEMIAGGQGEHFAGSTEEFFSQLTST